MKRFLKGSFKKNVLMITAGTAIAQIINFTLTPIITRLYNPEEYGIISVYTAILVSLSFLGSLNFEMGIPIAEDEDDALNIIVLSVFTLIVTTFLNLIILILFSNSFLSLFKAESLIKYKYFIPLGLFLLGLYNIFNQWALRNKDFKSITKTKFTQSIVQNSISIISGFLVIGPIGLILGRILGQSFGITTLMNSLIKNKKYYIKKFNKDRIIINAKRFIKFPLYATPRKFLLDISLSLPMLFITSLYGSKAVGFFGLANSAIQLPMNLIGNSISNVFYAECAKSKDSNPKRIKDLSNKLLKNLILIGLIPFITLFFFSPILFELVFGGEWREAGFFAKVLSFSVFFKLIFTPISSIFDVYEKQEMALILNILRIFSIIGIFILSKFMKLDQYYTVGLYSLSMSLLYFLQFCLAQRIIKNSIINKMN